MMLTLIRLGNLLPPGWAKEKNVEKDVIIQWKKLMGMSDLNAKFRYVAKRCRQITFMRSPNWFLKSWLLFARKLYDHQN